MRHKADQILVIACGALAREINDLKKTYGWEHLHLSCIDAGLHHRPALIPDALRKRIQKYRHQYQHIYIAYADCGTQGGIDKVIEEEGANIERLPGAHCYQFFAGTESFAELAQQEPGTFYLTDFLAQHFHRFVIEPLKIDQHPELEAMYFGNYKRLVFLSQTSNEKLLASAKAAAVRLGLEFKHQHCGYGELETELQIKFSGAVNG